MKSNKIIIGTRGSILALAQAEKVKEMLIEKYDELRENEDFFEIEGFDKKNPLIMSEIAWHYGTLGMYEESIKYVKKTLKLGRNDTWINVEYGACLANLDKYEELFKKIEIINL